MVPRFFAFVFALFVGGAVVAGVVTQRSVVNGVSVAVTAGNLSAEASVWDFAVVLDAPTRKNLPDDLVKSAVLVDEWGRQHKALIWEGAPSTGNHRAGVLKFIAVQPRPEWVELRIVRPGERKPRTFSWSLGNALVASR